jgi:hypothetical protein
MQGMDFGAEAGWTAIVSDNKGVKGLCGSLGAFFVF